MTSTVPESERRLMKREEKQLSGGARLNKQKTHCKRGHEFTEENTYRKPDGWRACRECRKESHRRNHRVTQREFLRVKRDIAELRREFTKLKGLWIR